MEQARHFRLSDVQPINIVLAVHFGLVLGFDYLDPAVRIALAGAIAAGYGALALLAVLSTSNRDERRLLSMVGVTIVGWLVGYMLVYAAAASANVGLDGAFRTLSPYLAAVALLGNRHAISPRLLIAGCLLLLGSAVVHAVAFPLVYLAGTPRWAAFTAGQHTSGYTLALAALLMLDLFRQRSVGRAFAAIFILSSLLVVIGYGVRTVFVLIAVFVLVDFAVRSILRTRVDATNISLVFLSFTLAAGLVLFVAVMNWSFGELSDFTSGRLSNYVERFSGLFSRSPAAFLFGTGPGSDKLVTTVWWWAEKDSHNDFIHLWWEGGLIALLASLAFLIFILRANPLSLLAPVAALVVSSAVSNALLARPNAAFLMFCIVALRASRTARTAGAPAGKPTIVPATEAAE